MIVKWLLLFLRHRYRILAGSRFAYCCIGLLLSATVIASTTNELAFKTDLIPGSNNSDVIKLQIFLNRSPDTQIATSGPGSPGNETSEFGSATMDAVIAFQNKYADEVLAPFGYKTGTGNVAAHTRKKLNSLYAELTESTISLSMPISDTEDISHEPPPLTTGPSNQLDDIIDEAPEAVDFIDDDGASNTKPAKKRTAKKTYFSKLRLAPIRIRTGGAIQYTQGKQVRGNSAPTNTTEIRTSLRIAANTYIITRSLATVSSDVQLNSSQRKGNRRKTQSSSLTGELTLGIVPHSNFPFRASITQSRLLQGFSLFDTPQFLSTVLTLQQDYYTYGRRDVFSTRYTKSRAKGRNSQSSQLLIASFGTSRFKKQVIYITVSTRRRTSTETRRLSNTLIATHKFAFRKAIDINSFTSVYSNKNTTGTINDNFSSFQLNTFATWRPTKKPYAATASTRIFNSTNGTQTQGINSNIGINYRYARFIVMRGSARAGVTESNGVRKKNLSISGSISSSVGNQFKYPLGSSTFGGFLYTRDIKVSLNASSTLSGNSNNTTSSSVNSRLSALATPSHNLKRSMAMLGGTTTLMATQLLPTSTVILKKKNSTARARTKTARTRVRLSTLFLASWTNSRGARIRSSATDSRAITGTASSFQSVNIQGSLRGKLSRHSSWKGTLTIRTTAESNTVSSSTRSSNSNISFSYQHARLLGMPKLRFTSTLHTSGNGVLQFQASNLEDNIRTAWKNRLTYEIGRLEVGLDIELAKTNNIPQSLILFTIERKFGDFR